MFKLNPNKINFKQPLGAGASGDVFPYQKDSEDMKWVVKQMFAKNIGALIQFLPEIILGFGFDHPNFLPVKGYCIQPVKPGVGFMVSLKLPRMKGSLRDIFIERMKENDCFTEEEIIKYFHGLTCGLEYLHNKKIYHRDIKPENILIDFDGKPVVADIGIAKFVDEDEVEAYVTDKNGTEPYIAPEIYFKDSKIQKKDLCKADAWSLGVVIAELCLMKQQLIDPKHFSEGQNKDYLEGHLDRLQKVYGKLFVEILSGLLTFDASKRKTVQEVRRTLEEHYPSIVGVENIQKQVLVQEKVAPSKQEEKKVAEEDEEEKEDFPSFLPEQHSMLDIVKNGLQETWRGLIEFRSDVPFGVMIPAKNQDKVTDETMSDFAGDVVRKLKENGLDHLDKIGLEFAVSKKLSDAGAQKMTNNLLSGLRNLKLLLLNFSSCENLTDTGVKNLSTCIGDKAKRLQHLSLNFRMCKQVTDQGLNELSQMFGRNLSNLRVVALNFYNCPQVTDNGVKTLSSQVKGLRHIESLNFVFRNCPGVTDSSLEKISGLITDKIQFLSLDFGDCPKVSDQSFQLIVSGIGKTYNRLEHLSLDFSGCKLITNRGLNEFLGQSQNSFEKLKYFSLNLSGCTQISDEGMKSISVKIGAHLKQLQNLFVNLNNCESFTNAGLKDFTTSLAENKITLQHLSLDLSNCNKISDSGLSELGLYLAKLSKSLFYLSLNFASCSQISGEGMEGLCEKIGKKLKYLQQLSLNICSCSQISSEDVASIKEALDDVSNPEILADY